MVAEGDASGSAIKVFFYQIYLFIFILTRDTAVSSREQRILFN